MQIAPELKSKVEALFAKSPTTLGSTLGFEYLILSKECVQAKMPVNERTKQPFGLLHGGASVALAESLASIGGWLNVDESKFAVVGIEINANHLKSTREGWVTGTAKPIHRGKSTHVWEIKIENEKAELVCVSRCTLAVVSLVK
jgi:1,4-dihydroxy-2-naphthoyl-CoA hydrolase